MAINPTPKKEKNIAKAIIQKTGKLFAGATGKYIADAMPVTSQTLKDAQSLGTDLITRVRSARQTVTQVAKTLRGQAGIKNIINWYLKEEDDFGMGDYNFDDASMTFDVPTDDIGEKPGELVPTETEVATDKIATAVVSSARQNLEGQVELTSNILAAVEKQTETLSSGTDNIIKSLNSILEVVTKNTAALIETTVAMGREEEKDVGAEMVKSGKFNLKDYMTVVKNNIMGTEVGMVASMLPMFMNKTMLDMIMTPEGILDMFFSDQIMGKIFPGLEKGLTELDDAISETIMNHLVTLAQTPGWDELATFKRVFGISAEREDFDYSRGTFEVQKVPFDSLTREAIINTIPGYLQKILEALTGRNLTYDYRRREFTTQKNLQEEMQRVSARRNTLWGVGSEKIQNIFGGDAFSRNIFDAIMTDLGSKTSTMSDVKGLSQARATMDSFKDAGKFKEYVEREIFNENNYELNDTERSRLDQIGMLLQAALDDEDIRKWNLQIANENLRRQSSVDKFIEHAAKYNTDIGEGFGTSTEKDIKYILDQAGFKQSEQILTTDENGLPVMVPNPEVQVETGPTTILDPIIDGLNYTNKALYEIFRRLDEGINVFKVGEAAKLTRKKFDKMGDEVLPPPANITVKKIRAITLKTDREEEDPEKKRENLVNLDQLRTPNLLFNNKDEEGNDENLSKTERVMRWSKDRFPRLLRAVLSGDPKEIRTQFALITKEVGEVGGKYIQDKAKEINDTTGNTWGYLKHKVTGAGYKFKDRDEEGNLVEREVAANEKGGLLGFLKAELSDSIENKSKIGLRWFNQVKSYFDDGSSQLPNDARIKRNKLINASIGALGGGILAGPVGVLVGGIGGTILGDFDLGKKLKDYLFGRDEEDNPTGLLSKFSDSILDPIRYQFGKTANYLGTILKKNFFGPLSDMGIAIKDRIIEIASSFGNSVFGKAFSFIGKVITAPFRLAGKLFKLPATIIGMLTRGAIGASGAVTGGAMGLATHLIAGKAKHKYTDENGVEHTVDTNEYIRLRKKKREKEYENEGKYELNPVTGEVEKDEEGNEVEGRWSSWDQYKFWRKQDRKRRKERWNEFTGEKIVSTKKLDEVKQASEKTAESTQKAADSLQHIDTLAGTAQSLFTHDVGLHERLDTLIDAVLGFFGKEKYTPPPETPDSNESLIEPTEDQKAKLEEWRSRSEALKERELKFNQIDREKDPEAYEREKEAIIAESQELSKLFEETKTITPQSPEAQLKELQGRVQDLYQQSKEFLETDQPLPVPKIEVTESSQVTEVTKDGSITGKIEPAPADSKSPDETTVRGDEVSEEKRFEENEGFANSAMTGALTAASVGGLSKEDQRAAMNVVKEAAKEGSSKSEIVSKTGELIRSQGEEVGEKEEKKSTIFDMIGGFLGKAAGLLTGKGFGDFLKDALIVAGLGWFFSGGFRDILEGIGRFVDYYDIDEKIDKFREKVEDGLGHLLHRKDGDDDTDYGSEDDTTEGMNVVTATLGDSVVHNGYDWANPFADVYHVQRDGAGNQIVNQTATAAKRELLFGIPLRNSIILPTMLSAKGNQLATQMQEVESTIRLKTAAAQKAKSLGYNDKAAKLEAEAAEATKKRDELKTKSDEAYARSDAIRNNRGSNMMHGIARQAGRVGVTYGLSKLGGKAAGFIAEGMGLDEEGVAKAEAIGTTVSAAAVTGNFMVSAATGKKSLVDKILDLFLKMLKFIAKKLKMDKRLAKVVSKIDGICNKIYNATVGKITDAIADKVAKAYTAVTGKDLTTGATLGIAIAVGALSGLASGYCNTAWLFGVKETDADPLMKTISTIMGGVFGALEWTPGINYGVAIIDIIDTVLIATLGCGIKQYIAQQLYKLMAGKEGTQKLEEAQSDFKAKVDATNEYYGTNLDAATFNDMVNSRDGWLGRLWNGKSQIEQWTEYDEATGEMVTKDRYVMDEGGGIVKSGGLKNLLFGNEQAYVYDENGELKRDVKGRPIKAIDEYGNRLKVKRDKDGNIVKDENGNIVYEEKIGDKFAKEWNAMKSFFTGRDVYETDEQGRVLYDEEGAPILKEHLGFKQNLSKLGESLAKSLNDFGDEFSRIASEGTDKLVNGFVNLKDKLGKGFKNIGDTIPKDANKLWGYIKSGNLNEFSESTGTGDMESISGKLTNVIYGISKVPVSIPVMVSGAAQSIYKGVKSIGEKLKQSQVRVKASNEQISEYIRTGDLEKLKSFQHKDDKDNPINGFEGAIVGINKTVGYPVALIPSVGKAIKSKFDSIVEKVKNSETVFETGHAKLLKNSAKGAMNELLQEKLETDNENVIGGFLKSIFTGDKIIQVIPTAIHWIGEKIKEKFSNISDSVSSDRSTFESAWSRIKSSSEKGDIAGIWSTKTQFSDADPVSPFFSISLFFGKLFSTVGGLFNIIGQKISGFLDTLENIPVIGDIIKKLRGTNTEPVGGLTDMVADSTGRASTLVDSETGTTTSYSGRSGSFGEELESDKVKAPVKKKPRKSLAHVGGELLSDALKKKQELPVGDSVEEGGNPLSKKGTITSGFGPRTYPRKGVHKGIDIMPADGSETADVQSTYSGTVSFVRRDVSDSDTAKKEDGRWKYDGKKSGGNMVWIDTDHGTRVKNMHLKAGSIPDNIKPGDRIEVGEKIGKIGSTGFSTGPHLHYQIERPSGEELTPVNPMGSLKPFTQSPRRKMLSRKLKAVGDPEEEIASSVEAVQKENETPTLGQFVETIKSIGSGILRFVTNGLLGNETTSTEQDGLTADEYAAAQNGGMDITGSQNAIAFMQQVAGEIGNKESPANSNKSKYGKWYGYNGVPWCMIFVQYCFAHFATKLPYKTASCSDLLNHYKKKYASRVIAADQTAKPGDIVIYRLGHRIDHTGIVEKDNGDGTITAIEGNTSASDKGSQSNGGCVARKKRKKSKVAAFIRAIDFDTTTNVSSGLINTNQVSTNVSTTNSSSYGNFPKYALSDKQIRGIANILQNEQPDLVSRQAEASLMANLVDMEGDNKATVTNLVDKVTGYNRKKGTYGRSWFAQGRKRFENPPSKIESSALRAAKSVLVEGKRTLPRYVNEHDMLGDRTTSDIISVSNNSKSFNKFDRSKYVPHVTKVKQDPKRFSGGGITWTFSLFPSSRSDPFGYTSEKLKNKWGDSHWPSGGDDDSFDELTKFDESKASLTPQMPPLPNFDKIGEELLEEKKPSVFNKMKSFVQSGFNTVKDRLLPKDQEEKEPSSEVEEGITRQIRPEDVDVEIPKNKNELEGKFSRDYTPKEEVILNDTLQTARKNRVPVPEEMITPEALSNGIKPSFVRTETGGFEWQHSMGDGSDDNPKVKFKSNPRIDQKIFSTIQNINHRGEEIVPIESRITDRITNTNDRTTSTIESIKPVNVYNSEREETTTNDRTIIEKITERENTQLNKDDIQNIATLMESVLRTLEKIASNTQSSANGISDLNQKEFVDTKLRNTLKALGNTKRRSSTYSNTGNTAGIARMSKL